jgi:hypothetical protein
MCEGPYMALGMLSSMLLDAMLCYVLLYYALGALHTMAEGREAVDFHESNCEKPRVRPLDPSHYGQSPKAVTIQNAYFFTKATNSRRKFGSDGNGTLTMVKKPSVFSIKNQSLTRSWPLDWRGYFEQGIKWDALLGLDIGVWTLGFGHFGGM